MFINPVINLMAKCKGFCIFDLWNKKSFQQRCTPEYTTDWVEKIKISRLWIKELIMR